MPRVLNRTNTRQLTENMVYVGRPSKWGNPLIIGEDGDRDKVVDDYHAWLLTNKKLLEDLHELRGKDLVCWCAPRRCHADVLLLLANTE